MREANLALIKRGYEAFAKGDLEAIRLMATDDILWRTSGLGLLEPEYKGPDGAIEYLTALFTLTDGTFKSEPMVFYADDETVTVIEHITAARLGRMLDIKVIHVFYIHDDKVFEVDEYVADPALLETFWS